MSATPGQRAAFRQLLAAGDVDALRAAWSRVAPHLPQPPTREAAELAMHHARTQTASLPLRARAWSHRWLSERGLPSGLPDPLRPRAERMFPRIAEGVGISVNFKSEWMKPAADEVRGAMEAVVAEAYADAKGDRLPDPAVVAARMKQAKARKIRALFGTGWESDGR